MSPSRARIVCIRIGFGLLAAFCAATSFAAGLVVTIPDSVSLNGFVVHFDESQRQDAEPVYEDLTGDRIDEGIVHLSGGNDAVGSEIGVLLVYEFGEAAYELAWSCLLGERPGGIDFDDLNGDSVSECVVWAGAGNHYTILQVLGHAHDDYVVLFENGTACHRLDYDSGGEAATITIARENWDDPDFAWVMSHESPLLEVWRWTGFRFEHDPEASTMPLISEKEALERCAEFMDVPGMDGAKPVMLLWTAGLRMYKFFGPEDF